MTRTTRVLVLSSYSQLEYGLVRQLDIPHGRRIPPTSVVTIASTLLGELGAELPAAIRGDRWIY